MKFEDFFIYWSQVLFSKIFARRKGVLVYLGAHKGKPLMRLCGQYKVCYGFEADPELCGDLKKRFARIPNVHIIHAAAATHDGEIEFHVSDNQASSSIGGRFADGWCGKNKVAMIKTVKVPCVNLCNFLREQGIETVDDYISDIQGYDLEVLKTLMPYINRKAIGSITCETGKDGFGNIYPDLPDNSESGFANLLGENYNCVAKGWGKGLKEGVFNNVPDDWWEMDCKWKPK